MLSRRAEAVASVALAAIGFTIVTGETLPVGLIADVARGVHATTTQVGLVITWYACVTAAVAVPLTRWSARFDRRSVLFGCAGMFGLGHIVTACATNLGVLLAGRAMAALSHGVYFAIATPAILRVARPESRARAGGRIAVGVTSALVVGTPLATLLGQNAGWRAAVLALAAFSLALAIAVGRLLPPLPAQHRDQPRSAAGVSAALRAPGLRTVFAVTLGLVCGHFCLFTYVAPFAGHRLGLHGSAFTMLLLAYGASAVACSVVGGRLVEVGPVRTVRVLAVLLGLDLLALFVAGLLRSPLLGVPLVLAWSGLFSALGVSTGLAVLRCADGPSMETANALYNIVFQSGIVGGSALGSAIFSTGHLGTLPLVAGTGVGLTALLLLSPAGRVFATGLPPRGDRHRTPARPGGALRRESVTRPDPHPQVREVEARS